MYRTTSIRYRQILTSGPGFRVLIFHFQTQHSITEVQNRLIFGKFLLFVYYLIRRWSDNSKKKRKEKQYFVLVPRLRIEWFGYGPRPAATGRTRDLGHSFSQYGPPGRWITYIYSANVFTSLLPPNSRNDSRFARRVLLISFHHKTRV